MSDQVKFLLAQHVPDVFRQEPRNVGVVAFREAAVAARFFGEVSPGQIDGRRLRPFQYPDVYRQWVEYWRRVVASPEDALDALRRSNTAHFRVVDGGVVSDTAGSSIEDVVNYIYSIAVSEGGLFEALGGAEDGEQAAFTLRASVADEFSRANILAADDTDQFALVKYPVRKGVEVAGSLLDAPHRPSFVQRNGTLFVMETVDFGVKEKERAKDHAGLASYMFGDIRQTSRGDAHAIAVIRLRPEDEGISAVRYSLAILHKEASEVVNWLDDDQRLRFLAERRKVALG